jgi:hypothetical protein
MSADQLPPALLARATKYRWNGRVHFPKDSIGEVVHEPDDDFVIFRRMVLDPADGQPEKPGAVFSIRFRFARFSDRINQRLSVVPAPLIAAQPGFQSKSWMLGRNTGMFRGVYEWDSLGDAEAYWTSFPMRLLKRRAVTDSVSYEITPM